MLFKELLNLNIKKLKYNYHDEEDEIKNLVKKLRHENYIERCNLKKREWRKFNKDYVKNYNNTYYNNNKDRQLENIKLYNEIHKEKINEYNKNLYHKYKKICDVCGGYYTRF